MKKWMAITMAAVMAVSAVGCGGTGSASGTAASTDSGTSAADTEADGESAADGAAESSSETADTGAGKVYQIATDITFKPFEFENDNGEMVGIDLDLLKAIAEDQGFDYELQVVGFNAAVMALSPAWAALFFPLLTPPITVTLRDSRWRQRRERKAASLRSPSPMSMDLRWCSLTPLP